MKPDEKPSAENLAKLSKDKVLDFLVERLRQITNDAELEAAYIKAAETGKQRYAKHSKSDLVSRAATLAAGLEFAIALLGNYYRSKREEEERAEQYAKEAWRREDERQASGTAGNVRRARKKREAVEQLTRAYLKEKPAWMELEINARTRAITDRICALIQQDVEDERPGNKFPAMKNGKPYDRETVRREVKACLERIEREQQPSA